MDAAFGPREPFRKLTGTIDVGNRKLACRPGETQKDDFNLNVGLLEGGGVMLMLTVHK